MRKKKKGTLDRPVSIAPLKSSSSILDKSAEDFAANTKAPPISMSNIKIKAEPYEDSLQPLGTRPARSYSINKYTKLDLPRFTTDPVAQMKTAIASEPFLQSAQGLRVKIEDVDQTMEDTRQPNHAIEQALLKMDKWADEWLPGKYNDFPKETKDLAWESLESCLSRPDIMEPSRLTSSKDAGQEANGVTSTGRGSVAR